MIAQPSPEAVELVANAGRTNGVLAVAQWQEMDATPEQTNADDAEEALFQYITRLEQSVADVYRCGVCLAIADVPERCPNCGAHRP